MIEVTDLQKSFEEIKAIDHITARIEEGHVFGLVGTNGAGKSTFLRLLCGVLKADAGQVLVDGEPVYNRPAVKGKLFYISDDMFFFKTGTPRDMAKLYATYYPAFDRERFARLLGRFGLDMGRKVNTFSKGMKKQLAVICGICAGTKYLLCDETFDGLDPVMRQAVKALFARDLDDMKLSLHKVQCVVKNQAALEHMKKNLEVVTVDQRGMLYTFTVRGTREQVVEYMELLNPVFYELLPLSLEEIFISETEVNGYDIKSLIL